MSTFDVREMLKLALKIEENGYKFYTYMAKKMESKEMKNLFTFLADEEVKHKRIFEVMSAKLGDYKLVENLPAEYLDYLRVYTNTGIFQQEMSEKDMEKLADISSAFRYSIGRESDSILFYHELKNFIPESKHNAIDMIIEEERKHYIKLSELSQQIKS